MVIPGLFTLRRHDFSDNMHFITCLNPVVNQFLII